MAWSVSPGLPLTNALIDHFATGLLGGHELRFAGSLST